MKKNIFLISIFIFCSAYNAFTQTDSLRQRIKHIIESKKADVGVAIYGFQDKDTLSINGNKHFPMQSVYKFHLALAVLDQVDKGKWALNQKIFIKKSDLLTETWSPLQKDYPEGNVELPLMDILRYTVSKSDNNGCDILFRLIGGTKEAENYIHSLGIPDISIKATEEEMSKDWKVQFTNWTTPLSTIQLLKKFNERQILSQSSYDFLWTTLLETSTGGMRLRGQLPEGTLVAHKTGTSGKDENGISAAVNDIGIVVLPDGKRFAICIFVTNSKEDDEVNEKIIADIAKEAWDYFIKKH